MILAQYYRNCTSKFKFLIYRCNFIRVYTCLLFLGILITISCAVIRLFSGILNAKAVLFFSTKIACCRCLRGWKFFWPLLHKPHTVHYRSSAASTNHLIQRILSTFTTPAYRGEDLGDAHHHQMETPHCMRFWTQHWLHCGNRASAAFCHLSTISLLSGADPNTRNFKMGCHNLGHRIIES